MIVSVVSKFWKSILRTVFFLRRDFFPSYFFSRPKFLSPRRNFMWGDSRQLECEMENRKSYAIWDISNWGRSHCAHWASRLLVIASLRVAARFYTVVSTRLLLNPPKIKKTKRRTSLDPLSNFFFWKTFDDSGFRGEIQFTNFRFWESVELSDSLMIIKPLDED